MESVRKALSHYGNLIIEKGLAAGAGGNISARDGNFVYLSPSGFCLDEVKENQWVKVSLKTGKTYGKLKPTCEISMHLGVYLARKDVNAVIHTHPPLTIGLISAGVEFKPVFPDFVAVLGDEIPVVEYVVPAGEEIRNAVVEKIKKYNVVLLKNHGVVCVGETLKEAFIRSWLVEESAKILFVGNLSGKINYLTEQQIKQLKNLKAEDYRKMIMKRGV